MRERGIYLCITLSDEVTDSSKEGIAKSDLSSGTFVVFLGEDVLNRLQIHIPAFLWRVH